MHDHDNQNESASQGGINPETEQRNQENETGQPLGGEPQAGQSQGSQAQGGQADYGSAGQQSDTLTTNQTGGQTTDETKFDQAESGQETDQDGSGFVGSKGDESSDYLTKGDNQDFQPEGQGATDTDAGTSDITTGQPTSEDSTLDDGADTSR